MPWWAWFLLGGVGVPAASLFIWFVIALCVLLTMDS